MADGGDVRVLGIDACKAGWVGVSLGGGEPRAYVGQAVADVVAAAAGRGRLDVVAIDMPIGLADSTRRRADSLAAGRIGSLRSSVFTTPVRAALEAPDYPTANRINKKQAGAGISQQAFALRPKLFEVERFVRRAGMRVVEVHPEVSFAQLAGAPLTVRKSTWAGAHRRRALLAAAGIDLTGELGEVGRRAGVDDVLDAAVAAWTARRVARDEGECLPAPPEVFSDCLPAAIWV